MYQRMRRIVSVCLALIISGINLTACSPLPQFPQSRDEGEGQGRLQVIATIFPYYDFARQIGGKYVDVSMVLPAGMDTHSFEPTPSDMVEIGKADVFLYNGGETELWADQVLEAAQNPDLLADSMMDHVELLEEEPGEADEHIWTSPVNGIKLAQQITADLSEADPEHQEIYKKNGEAYQRKLKKLDQEFREVVSKSEQRYLVFGDRFPLLYFVKEYGLEYSAAFAGCSTDTEPGADTIAYLTDQVRDRKLPAVLKIELTSGRIANAIAETAHAQVLTFYTCHNVTREQLEQGVTYLSLMEDNKKVLEQALQITSK